MDPTEKCGGGRAGDATDVEGDNIDVLEADVVAPPGGIAGRTTVFRGGALSAFGHRDFRLLWTGALVSNIGTWIHTTALLWYVKLITESNGWVGAVFLANFLPVLFFVLFAGSLADRYNRKKLIVLTQAAMMVAAFLLALLTTMGWRQLWLIMSLTIGMGIAFVFNFPAWRAMVPDLVPPEDILNGVALDAAQYNVARFVGPALGALILSAWSVAGAFYVNALSFLAVIGALLMIRTKTPGSGRHDAGTIAHIKEGLGYLRRNEWTRNLLLTLAVSSFFGIPFIVLLPAIAKDVLHGGKWHYGFLMGAVGLGAALGAPFVTRLSRSTKENNIIRSALVVFGLLLLGLSISRNFYVSLVLLTGMGTSYLMASATINTVLQSRVDREMRGRIMSFYILVFQGIAPLGGLLMGLLADARSTPFSLFLGGAVCLLLSVALFAFPSILKDAVAARTA